jgi:dipeptidyl aminopeptidase/acylaminoacyl peptidase
MKNYFFLLMAFILVKSFSQNQYPQSQEFGEWESIYTGDISNNGEWMFYTSSTNAKNDSLVIMRIEGGQLLKIAKASNARFTQDSKFVTAQLNFEDIVIVELEKMEINELEGYVFRDFTNDESYLIARKQSAKVIDLAIHNFSDGKDKHVHDLMEYSIHPFKNEIAIIKSKEGKSVVQILDLDKDNYTLLKQSSTHNFKDIAWSVDGKNLTFFEVPRDGKNGSSKIYSCDGIKCKNKDISNIHMLGNIRINSGIVKISQIDEIALFEGIPDTIEQTSQIPKGIQIWSGDDKKIYSQRKAEGSLEISPYSFTWNTQSNLIHIISDTDETEVISVNKDYILKIDKMVYQPQFKYVGDVDFYLHDLHTGKEQVFLKKQNPDKVFVDPSGKFIVYFREDHWHSFNLKSKNFVNLSKGVKTSFFNADADRTNLQTSYSQRIKWLEDEAAILVCDEFDVWKLSLDGKTQKRLTKGREIKRKYTPVINYRNPKNPHIDRVNSTKGLLFHAEDENRNTGYFLLPPHEPLLELTFGPFLTDGIQWDEDLNFLIFRLQSYNMPHKILFYNRKKNKTIPVVYSNENKKIKEWGKPELITFSLKDGSPGKYVLIYPSNYNSSQEYPMIVNIYENQSRRIHEFNPLSDFGTAGFNPTHYTRDGYFILLPDIEYEIGNPGISALKYVEESIDHVTQKVKIDTTKIGLYGFSFGGYESAFIATQTDRFAAVVAGAAITNLETYYQAINRVTGKEEMWRMEDYQMRMGRPYFDIKEEYIKNSPFHSIENLNAPILLWAGAEDYHIDYNESIRFYLALRRLKKKVELLLFEDEGHNIIANDKKEYLSFAIKEWFDKYCK